MSSICDIYLLATLCNVFLLLTACAIRNPMWLKVYQIHVGNCDLMKNDFWRCLAGLAFAWNVRQYFITYNLAFASDVASKIEISLTRNMMRLCYCAQLMRSFFQRRYLPSKVFRPCRTKIDARQSMQGTCMFTLGIKSCPLNCWLNCQANEKRFPHDWISFSGKREQQHSIKACSQQTFDKFSLVFVHCK